MIEHSAAELGFGWLSPVFLFASAVTGGGVLRAGLGIFFGLGKRNFLSSSAPCSGKSESRETAPGERKTHLPMWLPMVLLLVAALMAGVCTTPEEETAAERFVDGEGYRALVLEGKKGAITAEPNLRKIHYSHGIMGVGLAVLLAATALYSYRLPRRLLRFLQESARLPLRMVRNLHSGYVGDYVTWFMAGSAVIAVFALAWG